MQRVFVVQDLENAQFLCSDCGDVGHTAWFKDAGRFFEYEAAFESAEAHCSEGFIICEFMESERRRVVSCSLILEV